MSKTRHIAAVALIALLVLSPIAGLLLPIGAPTGAAIAQTDNTTDACTVDTSEDPRKVARMFSRDCPAFFFEASGSYADSLDAYNDAQKVEMNAKTAYQMLENSINDTEMSAWNAGETAFLNAYQNGSTLAVARQRGIDAMADTYSTRQINFGETTNNIVTSLRSIATAYGNFTYVDDNGNQQTFAPLTAVVNESGTTHVGPITSSGGDRDFPLLNGDNITQRGIFEKEMNNYIWLLTERGSQYYQYGSDQSITNIRSHRIETGGNGSYSYPVTNQLLSVPRWADLWDSYQNSYQKQASEFEDFANATYSELDAENIDATDLLNRLNQMQNYQQLIRNASGNVSFNDATVALTSMGLSPPDNSTAYLEMQYQTEYGGPVYNGTGLLLSHAAPTNGSWETGTRYNTSEIEGAQIFNSLDGEQRLIRGNFTITEAFTSNGTVIDGAEFTPPDTSYKAANYTELRNEIIELSDRIEELKNRSVTPGGAGGGASGVSWPDLGIPNPFNALGAVGQWIALFAVLFVALLLLTVVS